MRMAFLQALGCLLRQPILGDLALPVTSQKGIISCCIITKGKADNFQNLINDLWAQSLERSKWEVVVVNSGSDLEIRSLCENARQRGLAVTYFLEENPLMAVGALRNKTVKRSLGESILFLDDDTRLKDNHFLVTAVNAYKHSAADIIIPQGFAEVDAARPAYDYLDRFSFAARCIIYKKDFFVQLKGFFSFLNGYEDIDLGIRAVLAKGRIMRSSELSYFHPPLFFSSMDKPFCIGQSVWALRKRLPFLLWLMIYINSLRFLLYVFVPTQKNQQWLKISLGCLLAPWKRKKYFY